MCGRFTMTRRDRIELAAMLGVPEHELGDYSGQLLQRRRNKSCFSGHAPVRKLIDAANNCGWKHNRWLETPLCDAA
jgi:hypothetical protein